MPILSRTGRRTFKHRALVGTMYVLLVSGAVTMIYPMLLMISGSTKSTVDAPSAEVIPPFVAEDQGLYAKHVEALFNESLDAMRVVYDSDAPSFDKLDLPERPNEKLVEQWRRFLTEADLPLYTYGLGHLEATQSRGVMPYYKRQFRSELETRVDGAIERLNHELKVNFVNWTALVVPPEGYLFRRNKPTAEPFLAELWKFKQRQPVGFRYYFSIEGMYKTLFLKGKYTRDIATYNREHGTSYASYDEVHLSRTYPSDGTELQRKDWEEFVRSLVNLLWVRVDASAAAPDYRAYLQAKYETIEGLNRNYAASYKSFLDVPMIDGEPPAEGLVLSDWEMFLQGWTDPRTGKMHAAPLASIRIHSIDFLFRDFLQQQFGTIAAFNAAMGTAVKDWIEILPPQQEFHYLEFLAQRTWLRWEFFVRNYISVLDYMLLHGRGVLNTVIYCSLSILAALIVNPLAAYALSRYKPPSTYKVLLFLMMTMAFPPMVTQIPVFLMLRDFNLLNTFWALILPGLANGYSIFLLKGFFDSLPQELYESAALDGAGEVRVFWQITMSLSTPILAVIALNAFTHAYANFMFALLICQDSSMWTLMVWLYQLQSRGSTQGIIFASLIIAAIPTFLVFVLCQNVIMKGIVVPVEK